VQTVGYRKLKVEYPMMKNDKNSQNHLVQVIVRESCSVCDGVVKLLEAYQSYQSEITLQIIDLEKGDILPKGRQSIITPATWVDGQLWYLGGIDLDQFAKKIDGLNLPNHETETICA